MAAAWMADAGAASAIFADAVPPSANGRARTNPATVHARQRLLGTAFTAGMAGFFQLETGV